MNFEKDYPKSPADIGIIDYKVNNVRSVLRAFQKIGKKVSIVETPAELKKMKAIVLPGVGSFGEGMRALSTAHLVEPLKEHVKQGKPILGLCLGMQMLFSESLEFGKHKGLDLIAGKVVPLKPVSEVKVIGYKLPHIGWNDIRPSKKALASSLTYGLGNPASVYFVHSFYPSPAKKSVVLATTKYGGQEFCSIVHKDNIMGTQFHPEKSGEVGLGILKQFCELAKV
ncbi:MAG TPA: imidazole glycerol phosphate synthase subunit HisH [Candidatus Paceibacterota bacterium]